MHPVSALVCALGILPVGCAVAAFVGLGVVRDLGAGQVALTGALLVMLPVAGLWALAGRKPWGLAASLWVWPLALLGGLPGYFPDQVPEAIATGFAVIAAPAGPEWAARGSRLGERVGAPIASAPKGEAPAPEAARAVPECLPSPLPATGDQVALPYEGQGHSMAIPVQFGDVELPMLFDTGASVTTLDTASLRRLGIRVPTDAPRITLRTANGERTAQLVVVPKVWIGGLAVDGVTVGVCEECADEKVSGLLGLNVSSQFLVTVDTARKEVVFQDRGAAADRLLDVGPWLHIAATATIYPDTRVEVRVEGRNDADRVIADAEIGLKCGEEAFTVHLTNVPPLGSASQTANLPRGTDCEPYRVALEHARW